MATREELYAAIEREREYQEQKWPQNGKPLDLYGRMIVAHAELQEARLAYCKHTGNDEALKELLQVVAVGVSAYRTGVWITEFRKHEDSIRTLPEWLELLELQFALARKEAPLYYLGEIVGMGMAALLQHGIVERDELAEQEPPSLELTQTPRGFDFLEFQDRNNQKCTLQKSSCATEDAIWLGIHDEKRMHLTQEQVAALLPFLIRFAETGELS